MLCWVISTLCRRFVVFVIILSSFFCIFPSIISLFSFWRHWLRRKQNFSQTYFPLMTESAVFLLVNNQRCISCSSCSLDQHPGVSTISLWKQCLIHLGVYNLLLCQFTNQRRLFVLMWQNRKPVSWTQNLSWAVSILLHQDENVLFWYKYELWVTQRKLWWRL